MYYNRNLITAEQRPASINDASGVFDLQTQAYYRAQNDWPFGDNIVGAIIVVEITSSRVVRLSKNSQISCNYTVDWGDGSSLETSTATSLDHSYATGGIYTIKLSVNSGTWVPKANGDTRAFGITKYAILNQTSGSSAFRTYQGMRNLKDVAFPAAFYAGITNLQLFFADCFSLKTAPFIDTSSATSFQQTFGQCSALESVPLYDTSNVTSFAYCFRECINLKEIPLFDTSSGTNFGHMCNGCSRIDSFPAMDFSAATTFSYAWFGCSNLVNFPANMFDNLNTNTLISGAFNNAFHNAALSVQSIENILTSLVTSGATNVVLHIGGGQNANYSNWSETAKAAFATLSGNPADSSDTGRGWTITYNSPSQNNDTNP